MYHIDHTIGSAIIVLKHFIFHGPFVVVHYYLYKYYNTLYEYLVAKNTFNFNFFQCVMIMCKTWKVCVKKSLWHNNIFLLPNFTDLNTIYNRSRVEFEIPSEFYPINFKIKISITQNGCIPIVIPVYWVTESHFWSNDHFG